ncbi:hypothetical protein AAFF_G00107610 [Aldrovandia affinis]|uniref:Notch C-terminal domain-containing protein n=1 Tax=Aldrovandia affinis TaxID=143900 RepID=A0AAD7RU84_9TELE|nr:hypothetical protein AAFF_G00107610 [Aldrovandia affinis]
MLGQQQQSWAGHPQHSYRGPVFGLLSHQHGALHPALPQHHQPGPLSSAGREQLPSIVAFQMMQAPLPTLDQGQPHPQQGPSHLHHAPGLMYPPPKMGHPNGMSHSYPHAPHPHSHSHALPHGHGLQAYQQSPVDKYPTPSQHSYTPAGSESATPGHPAHPPGEHPYLTPFPESPDPWSSSSPHSNSDWSDVTTSPTPLGNGHAPPPGRRAHLPEQQAQLEAQKAQARRGSTQAYA